MISYIIGILLILESNDCVDAVGDQGRAVGCLQIHKVMVDEVNRIQALRLRKYSIKYTDYNYEDRLDKHKSIQMATIFLSHCYRLGYTDVYELASKWNTGNPRDEVNPKYIKKFKLLERQLQLQIKTQQKNNNKNKRTL